MRKRKRTRRTGLGVIVIMVLLVCGIVLYKRQGLSVTDAKIRDRIEVLEKKIEEEKEETLDIQEMRAYVQTLKYIEDMAREKLGLVYKDEIIFKSK